MANVIVTGHGGYATAVRRNLTMLTGMTEGMAFVDFNEGDDLDSLTAALKTAAEGYGEGADLLFCCDLTGGSPFRQSAMLCASHPGWVTVAGINSAAYTEMVFAMEESAAVLADQAIETTKNTVVRFPPQA